MRTVQVNMTTYQSKFKEKRDYNVIMAGPIELRFM